MPTHQHFHHSGHGDSLQSVPLKLADSMDKSALDSHHSGNMDIERDAQRDDQDKFEEPYDMTLSKFNRQNAGKNLLNMFLTLVFLLGLPLALYFGLRKVIDPLYALLISGIPPLLHTIFTFIMHRRVDFLGLLVVFAFVISAVISIVTGDVRAALLRDSAVTMTIGALFAVTLIPLRTRWISIHPITWSMTHRIVYDMAPALHWRDAQYVRHEKPLSNFIWESLPSVRRGHYFLTGGYAVGLTGEFVARVIMVEATELTVDQIVLYGNVIVGVVIAVMVSASIYVSIKTQRAMVQWGKDNDYTAKYNETHHL